jgi:hypothetical protein
VGVALGCGRTLISLVTPHRVIAGLCCFFAAASADAQATTTSYRARLLGVFSAQTGEPIEGADVVDMFSKTKAVTTKTGTVSLAFLPDSGSLVRISKIGYRPTTMVVAISPADTVPITVVLEAIATTLPTVVTKETARPYVSPGMQQFDNRRRHNAFGQFLTEEHLRKNDNRTMTNVIRSAGVQVLCGRTGKPCYAVSNRQVSKSGLSGAGGCTFDVYLDGALLYRDNADLEMMQVNALGGVEIYKGAAAIPSEYNMTGSSCGVLLLWSRER